MWSGSRGDSVAVTIDAFPDTTFVGRVTKISNSAKLTADPGQRRLERPRGGLRRRDHAAQSAARYAAGPELHGAHRHRHAEERAQHPHHRAHRPGARAGAQRGQRRRAPPATRSSPEGQRKPKEREGVFVVRDGIATFRPVKVGIAGDEYFEVLEASGKARPSWPAPTRRSVT